MQKVYSVSLIIICCILSFIQNIYSQPPTIQWEKCYGGIGFERAYSVKQTSDNGYIAVGNTTTNDGDVNGWNGYYDYWIIKTDSSGNLQWQKCLGGSDEDMGQSIQQTFDGGYVVAGWSNSHDSDVTGLHGNGRDFWIVKLDSAGNIQWEKCHGGSLNEYAYSIQQTRDSGYYVVGPTTSIDGEVTGNHGGKDSWITKFDTYGNLEWEKAMGGTSDDEAFSVIQTFDGGCIVAGRTNSIDGDVMGLNGGYDCWIVKLDSAGNVQWKQCYGGHTTDAAWSIVQTKDSGYAFAGQPTSQDSDVTGNHGNTDYWLVKIDSIGTLQWQKCFGGSQPDNVFSLKVTSDGGYIMAGTTNSTDFDVTGLHNNSFDYWIVKADSSGDMEWQKCYGGSAVDQAQSIEITNDGGYIVAGFSYSLDGDVTGNHNAATDFWLVKLAPPLGAYVQDESKSIFKVYPNPVVDKIEIENIEVKIEKVEILNLVGEKIMSIECNQNTVSISTNSISPGMYFVSIHTEKGTVTKKIVKE